MKLRYWFTSLCFAFGIIGVSQAATVVYNISGTIAAYQPNLANNFSGSFTFDTGMLQTGGYVCNTSATANYCNAQQYVYTGHENSAVYGRASTNGPMSFNFVSGSSSMSGGSSIVGPYDDSAIVMVNDGLGTNQGIINPDGFSFYLGQSSANPNPNYYGSFKSTYGNYDGVEIDFFDSSGMAFASTALTSSLDLSSFSTSQLKLYGVAHDPTVYNITAMSMAAPVTLPSAVPESATWAMMIGGFGMIGSTLRRQRKGAPADRAVL